MENSFRNLCLSDVAGESSYSETSSVQHLPEDPPARSLIVPSSRSLTVPLSEQMFDPQMAEVVQLMINLGEPELRESALNELSNKREILEDLAPLLWHSFGTITILLKEITMAYPLLTPPMMLSAGASNRVWKALTLFQCVASHPETRKPFVDACLPVFVYPFLKITSNAQSLDLLRLTSLRIFVVLVKDGDTEVICHLLETEFMPYWLKAMENGNELAKTVGTFILLKLLCKEVGLMYICATAEHFHAIIHALADMVESLVDRPSAQLLKNIIRCYLRLSEFPQICSTAHNALREHLPKALKDGTFDEYLRVDSATHRSLNQLLVNCYGNAHSRSVRGGRGRGNMRGN